MIAVRKKFTDIAELLLDSCTDSLLVEALYTAAEVGNTKIVRYILNKGISPNDPLAWEPLNKYTPLHIAISNMNAEVVRLLLSFGADLNTKGLISNTSTNELNSSFSYDLGYESFDYWKIAKIKTMFILLLFFGGREKIDDTHFNEDTISMLKDCVTAFKQIKAMPHLGKLIEANVKKENAKVITVCINN